MMLYKLYSEMIKLISVLEYLLTEIFNRNLFAHVIDWRQQLPKYVLVTKVNKPRKVEITNIQTSLS